jgi:predicted transcriptional regulator
MVRLGELEQQVIDVLWGVDSTPMTGREVAGHFPDHAYTTVMTVLDRLERKGLVRRIRGTRAHRYEATASREAYAATLMREALDGVPDPDAVLVRFAESVTPEEAELLRQLLNDAETPGVRRVRR